MTSAPSPADDARPADPPPDPNIPARVKRSRGDQPPARPRWVNIFGIVIVVLVVLFLVLHVGGFLPTHFSLHG
jgi:hypothetical protein